MTEDLKQYVNDRVQEANEILEQIPINGCVKEAHESPRIAALIERLNKKGKAVDLYYK